jgi:hypothetical protein
MLKSSSALLRRISAVVSAANVAVANEEDSVVANAVAVVDVVVAVNRLSTLTMLLPSPPSVLKNIT